MHPGDLFFHLARTALHLFLGLGGEAADRYQRVRELGRGGMGEVTLCLDRRIGREVALKRSTSGRGATEARGVGFTDRFLREICVQGQLEHPTVVPLHDLSVDDDGGVYFTMKHVRGQTLKSILGALGEGDPSAVARFPLRKLLGAFANVCLGVAFAHSRGVIHRDLKPDNLMLGEFGEVYILDWGVAKVVNVSDTVRDVEADPSSPRPALAASQLRPSDDGSARDGDTAAGSMIGTPGYMSPEQCAARSGEVDERADVYALGAVLFEILAGEPLHAGDGLERLQSTLKGADARVGRRTPDREPLPELEAACIKATAGRRADRFASARASRRDRAAPEPRPQPRAAQGGGRQARGGRCHRGGRGPVPGRRRGAQRWPGGGRESTLPVLFVSALLLIAVAAMGDAQARNSIREAERSLSVHAWQLRQLVPPAPPPPGSAGAADRG